MRSKIIWIGLFFFAAHLHAQSFTYPSNDAELMSDIWSLDPIQPEQVEFIVEPEPFNRLGTLFPPTTSHALGHWLLPVLPHGTPSDRWTRRVVGPGPDTYFDEGKRPYYLPDYTFAGGNIAFDPLDASEWVTVKNKKDRYKLVHYGGMATDEEFPYHDDKASFAWPTIFSDGSMFFFCAKYPGGTTGWDIYYCKREDGVWSPPVKMGPEINTDKDEIHPFCGRSPYGEWKVRLFFSSNGHKADKDFDLYTYDRLNDSLVRLPYPINTCFDDFAMSTGGGPEFWVSSNRPLRGTHEAGPQTLFTFHPKEVLSFRITDSLTRLPLEGVKVRFRFSTGPDYLTLTPQLSDEDGYWFFWPEQCKPYDFHFIHPDYDTLVVKEMSMMKPAWVSSSESGYNHHEVSLRRRHKVWLGLKLLSPTPNANADFQLEVWENGTPLEDVYFDTQDSFSRFVHPSRNYRIRVSHPALPPQEYTFTTSGLFQQEISHTFDFRAKN